MNNLNSILDYLKVFNNINKRPAYEPRTMAQEPRNMYAGGQLVQNTVDGSRPDKKVNYNSQEYDYDSADIGPGGYPLTAGLGLKLYGKSKKYVERLLEEIKPGMGALKPDRSPEKLFIKVFSDFNDTYHGGNLNKASEAIGQRPEKIKGIFFRTFGKGSVSTGNKTILTIPAPKNGLSYSDATTKLKKQPEYFIDLITPKTKDLYLAPKDIGHKLGIDFGSNKGSYDRFVENLQELNGLKVKNKMGESGINKVFHFEDAIKKLLNKYKTKKIKGEAQSNSNRLFNEIKLDPELYKVRKKINARVMKISKDENIYLRNAIDDAGHTVSIQLTNEFPKLFKNSNVNRINSLVYQDPYLNQQVMRVTGYESKFKKMFTELDTLVNKPVTAKTQQRILDIKKDMNVNYKMLIRTLLNKEGELKEVLKKAGKEISSSHLEALSKQTDRIPKIDVKVPKIGEKFLSENIYADMSKVNPKYIMGYVDKINPAAKKFTDLSLSERAVYEANLQDQAGMILGDYYKKVNYPKGQIGELQEALTYNRYASGGNVKRMGFAKGRIPLSAGGWLAGLLGPEAIAFEYVFYKASKRNYLSQGYSEEEAKAMAIDEATWGITNKGDPAYAKELEKVAKEMGIDSKAFDTIREVSERTLKGKKEQKRDKDMLGGTWRSEEDKNKFLANRQKLYAAYDKETEKLWRKAKTEIGMDKAGKVFPTPNLDQIATESMNVEDADVNNAFEDLQKVATEKLRKRKSKVFDVQSKQANPEGGSTFRPITNWFTRSKDFLALRTKGQEEQRLINEMAKNYPQELYRYNLARNIDPDKPVTEESLEALRSRHPELHLREGGIASLMKKKW